MEEKIKEIIAFFIKTSPEQINSSTVIDRSVVSNSILLHRMYAKLAEEGIIVENYSDIRNFGNLLQSIQAGIEYNRSEVQPYGFENIVNRNSVIDTETFAIGIDAETISAMPVTDDFREDEFYKMNFTSSEMSYCILQPDPYASFAGLFAAKEAIVKANNSYRNRSFNSIFIDHMQDGRPVHNEFQISISHTGQLAVAVAAKSNSESARDIIQPLPLKEKSSVQTWLVVFSLIFSVIACIIALLN